MANVYSIYVGDISFTSVTLGATYTSGRERGDDVTMALIETASETQVWSETFTVPQPQGTNYPTTQPTGLTPGTEYRVTLSTEDGPIASVLIQTRDDSPRSATTSQWEDLAARVKATVPPMIVVNTATFPTSSTPGVVGQLYYVNYGNHYLYVCTSSENGVTTWQSIQLISGGSGD